MFKHSTIALLLGLVGLAHQAQAAEYKTVAIDKSKVTFSYKQMGVSVDGHFNKFVSQMSFDPAKPANAKASIEIELASVDAGSSEADEEVMGKSWFNVKSFPKATFVSTQIKPAGTQQFEVTGNSASKAKPVTLRLHSNTHRKASTASSRAGLPSSEVTSQSGRGLGPSSILWRMTFKSIFNSLPNRANNF